MNFMKIFVWSDVLSGAVCWWRVEVSKAAWRKTLDGRGPNAKTARNSGTGKKQNDGRKHLRFGISLRVRGNNYYCEAVFVTGDGPTLNVCPSQQSEFEKLGRPSYIKLKYLNLCKVFLCALFKVPKTR